MNDFNKASKSGQRYSPLGQLVMSRIREFFRQPEVVFWVYGFPIVMVVALGIAFRNRPVERIAVDVQQCAAAEPAVEFVREALTRDSKYVVQVHDEAGCRLRLRTGKTDLVVLPA